VSTRHSAAFKLPGTREDLSFRSGDSDIPRKNVHYGVFGVRSGDRGRSHREVVWPAHHVYRVRTARPAASVTVEVCRYPAICAPPISIYPSLSDDCVCV
jgi:hypothetical protein